MTELEGYPLPRSALLFMATVDEARLTNEGPFRAIAPIFRIALEPQRGQILNVAHVATALSPILGANFTHHTVEAFLPQLAQLGWLLPAETGQNQAAYLVPSTLPILDEREAEEASAAKLMRLYAAFCDFLDMTAPLLKFSINQQQFQWQIFRWATSLDGSDKEAIRSQAEKLASGGRQIAKYAFLDENQRFSRIEKTLSVQFAAFVKWLSREGRVELNDIVSLTELGLAIEFLEELRSPTVRNFDKLETVFVLDAPIILDLLGLSGPSRQVSIARCLATLREHGAKVVTLSHCLRELSDILTAVLARPGTQRFGLTGDALRSNPKLIDRARQVARQPDKAVKVVEVEELHFDPTSPLNATFFSEDLIDRFRNAATWHDLSKSEQRERDALSIGFVMRRRQGNYSSDVLDSRYVLVARNSTFTSFSEVFVRSNLGVPEYAVGPAIETKTLAAFVWMRFGSTASPDLPQMHLIAACDRLLATNGELLRRAEKRLLQLKGETVAAALLGSQQAVLDLVIAVGGSPDVLDAADGDDLLRAFTVSAEERGRVEERKKASREQVKLTEAISSNEELAKQHAGRAIELAGKLLKNEDKLRQAEKVIEEKIIQDDNRINSIADRIIEKSKKTARAVVNISWIITTLVGVIGQFFIWNGISWWLENGTNFMLGTAVFLSTAFSVACSFRWVPSVHIDLAGLIQVKLSRSKIRTYLKRIELDDEKDRVRKVLEERGSM